MIDDGLLGQVDGVDEKVYIDIYRDQCKNNREFYLRRKRLAWKIEESSPSRPEIEQDISRNPGTPEIAPTIPRMNRDTVGPDWMKGKRRKFRSKLSIQAVRLFADRTATVKAPAENGIDTVHKQEFLL